MATFTVDPTDPEMVVMSGTGLKLPISAVPPQDIVTGPPPAAPAPVQPVQGMTPRAQAVIAKRDAVMGPLEVASVTTNTQKGIAPSVLQPVLQSNIDTTEKLAGEMEAAGKAKTDRVVESTTKQIGEVDATIKSATETEATKRQRAEIARLNGLAIAAQEDPEIDPDRFVDSLSTGRKIMLAISAIITGAVDGIRGEPGKENAAVKMLMNRIDQDLAAQKEAIASGRVRRGNLIQWFREQGMTDDQAADAARATITAQVARKFELEERLATAPEYAENAKLTAAQMRAQTQQANNQLQLSLGADRQTTSVTKERPKPAGGGPADILAALKIGDALIEKANAEKVAEVVGHPVSADEAKKIKDDAKDYSQRRANNASTQQAVVALATKLGLERGPDSKWKTTKQTDAGTRPLGISAFSDEQARDVDRLWSQLKEAKIMTMSREPANSLQQEFGEAVSRPFWDDEIPNVLNTIEARVSSADDNLRSGYPDASKFYDSTSNAPASDYTPGKATPR